MTDDVIEVWIAMNESGEYEVGSDEDVAVERFDESIGGQMRRLVRLKVVMAPPEVTEVDVTVPKEVGQIVKVEVG
jgi:hypothetical protein